MESSLKKNISIILGSISILIILSFTVFLINQTAQIINLVSAINPLLGQAVGWILIVTYAALAIFPVIFYLRLPKILQAPMEQSSPEFDIFIGKLGRRLKKNKYLTGMSVSTFGDIEKAIKILNKQADILIRKNATTVFLTTAISQSGRLDAISVLVAQVRMVWQVAHVYYHRPSFREMLQLYANVAGTAFIAGELNDIDISEQVEPIITSVLGASLTGSIPGITNVAGIVTNSLLTGSANAYLTLRVGAITKQYCGSLLKKERSVIRRSASLEGAKMLSIIVMNSASNISKSIVNAALKTPGKFSRDVIRTTWGKISGKQKTGTNLID
jgi:hypothetical protein